jgi:hypothetical protein
MSHFFSWMPPKDVKKASGGHGYYDRTPRDLRLVTLKSTEANVESQKVLPSPGQSYSAFDYKSKLADAVLRLGKSKSAYCVIR